MTDRLNLWQQHHEALGERDKARAARAAIQERIESQKELIEGAPKHNAELVEAQINAELDGAKAPKEIPIDVAFETQKIEALNTRLVTARSEESGAQNTAESTLKYARDADVAAIMAWAKATSPFKVSDGPQAIDESETPLRDLAASYATHRASGGTMRFGDWVAKVAGFADLDGIIARAKTDGLAWSDEQEGGAA